MTRRPLEHWSIREDKLAACAIGLPKGISILAKRSPELFRILPAERQCNKCFKLLDQWEKMRVAST